MRKVWIVAAREYRTNVRSKTFIIVMALMPIFMFGSILVQGFMEDRVDTKTKRVAVLDHSGKMYETLNGAAAERNKEDIFGDDGKQIRPRYELSQVTVDGGDRNQQLLELSDQIRDKQLFAFIEIGPRILDGEAPGEQAEIRYYSNQPTYRDIQRWLSRIINSRVQTVRLNEAGIDKTVVEKAMQPVAVDNLGLLSLSESGEIQEAEKVDMLLNFLVPFGIMMFMWMALVVTTQPMLNGILEEKMQRISEVLIGSVPPFQLMLGKLIGYVLVALTLIAFYSTGGYLVADHMDKTSMIPTHLIGWFLVFLSLAILMYGSMFLAVGACCNDLREAQNLVFPVWIPLIIPMFFMTVIVQHPNSSVAVGLSLFPLCSPMTMMIRMAVPPGVTNWWEPLLAVLGTVLTTLLCVWAGGRIFRVGLLLQGKPPKLSQMIRWAVRG